jgi:type I restriction enzyme, S subunit
VSEELPELPEGWEWTTLGELSEPPQYGYTTKAAPEGDLKLLRTTDISRGEIEWDRVPYCYAVPEKPEKYLLAPEDIVISRSGSVGLNARIGHLPAESVFASYLIRLRPLDSRLGPYLELFMASDLYWNQITRGAVGTGMNNISAPKLSAIQVPLPPLDEQTRIVHRAKSLVTTTAQAVSELAEARLLFRKLRARLLDEMAAGEDTVPLSKIAAVNSGITKNKARERGLREVAYLRTANVQAGSLDLDVIRLIGATPEQIDRHRLIEGDVLIVEGGDADKVGRGWIWEGQIDECLHQNHVFVVRAKRESLEPRFLAHFVNAPATRAYFLASAKQTTNLASINKTQLSSLPVPDVSTSEQLERVNVLEAQFSQLDELETAVDAISADCPRLNRSVLSQAMLGHLADPEPGAQTANDLLAAIAEAKNPESTRRKPKTSRTRAGRPRNGS